MAILRLEDYYKKFGKYDEITCPHCGFVSYEYSVNLIHKYICPNCQNSFIMTKDDYITKGLDKI